MGLIMIHFTCTVVVDGCQAISITVGFLFYVSITKKYAKYLYVLQFFTPSTRPVPR